MKKSTEKTEELAKPIQALINEVIAAFSRLDRRELKHGGWNRLTRAQELGEFDAMELVAFDKLFWGEIYASLAEFQTEKRILAFKNAYWKPGAIKARRASLYEAKAARQYYKRLWHLLSLLSCDPQSTEFREHAKRLGYNLSPPLPSPERIDGCLSVPIPPPTPPGTIDPYDARDQEIGKLIRAAWEHRETAFFAALNGSAEELHETYELKPGPKKKGRAVNKLPSESIPSDDWRLPPDPRKPDFEPWEWRRVFGTNKSPQAKTKKWALLREFTRYLGEQQLLPSRRRIIKRLYGSDSKKDSQKRQAREALKEMGIP